MANTTCATCHRLNGLRFDFHSLSHFEDNDHTVSPRVEADVARDRAWSQAWLSGLDWAEEPPVEPVEPADGTPSDDMSWEPSDTLDRPVPVLRPIEIDVGITPGDVDLDTPTDVTIRLLFSHAAGDLDLTLLDDQGLAFAWSASTADEERIDARLPAGRTYVRVYGFQDAAAPYQLQVR